MTNIETKLVNVLNWINDCLVLFTEAYICITQARWVKAYPNTDNLQQNKYDIIIFNHI